MTGQSLDMTINGDTRRLQKTSFYLFAWRRRSCRHPVQPQTPRRRECSRSLIHTAFVGSVKRAVPASAGEDDDGQPAVVVVIEENDAAADGSDDVRVVTGRAGDNGTAVAYSVGESVWHRPCRSRRKNILANVRNPCHSLRVGVMSRLIIIRHESHLHFGRLASQAGRQRTQGYWTTLLTPWDSVVCEITHMAPAVFTGSQALRRNGANVTARDSAAAVLSLV